MSEALAVPVTAVRYELVKCSGCGREFVRVVGTDVQLCDECADPGCADGDS